MSRNILLAFVMVFFQVVSLPAKASHMDGGARIRASFRQRCGAFGCRSVSRTRIRSRRCGGCFKRNRVMVRASAVIRFGGCARRMC